MNIRKALKFFLLYRLTVCFSQTVHAVERVQFASASESVRSDYYWLIMAMGVCVMLAIVVCMLLLHIRRLKAENAAGKMTDEETGMGNLQFFKYHFKYAIGDNTSKLYYLAYIVLDISYLRSYYRGNTFEEMLKYTASVMSEATGEKEISARISENGFAFAFRSTSDEDAKNRLDALMTTLNSFETVKGNNDKLVYHCAVYHLESADKNCEILLLNLRKNCNRILDTDKNFVYCDSHLMNVVREEKKTVDSLLKGLENDEFKMYLQFIVDNRTRKIVSAELLSRWDQGEKGLLGPGEYIADLETSGLISRHDFYMFERACRLLESWRGTEFGNIMLSCNFTRITLSEEDFIDRIIEISNNYHFDKSMLAIEMTEDAIERDKKTARRNANRCKELGFAVYLDDLGTGYTSLVNLCDYPIDVVKLDRDLLLKTRSEKGKELFTGVIALAHSLNINVVCEGVETEEQNALVSASDCDYIQGWYYSKALPVEACESFIMQYRNA